MHSERFRLSIKQAHVYQQALAALEDKLRREAKGSTDKRIHRDLAMLNLLRMHCPQHLPYDVVVDDSDWRLVSQALRVLEASSPDKSLSRAARALYQHWNTHRHVGFPNR